MDLPPWKKGRYGSAIGRAVHGVLQVVDLVSGSGLEDAVAAQCLGRGRRATRRARGGTGALRAGSEVVKPRPLAPHWRESYVGIQEDGTVLEGFVDLIYREDDGSLVVVDYKTDDILP